MNRRSRKGFPIYKVGDIVSKFDRKLKRDINGIIAEINYQGEPMVVRIDWYIQGTSLDPIQNIYGISKLS